MTTYWPPHMPPMPTNSPPEKVKTISRKDYIPFLIDNPTMKPMPIHMRTDLPLLPEE